MNGETGGGERLRRELDSGGRVRSRFVGRPAGLNAMLASAVASRGGHDALVFEDRRWSWSDLEAIAGRLAGGLRSAGIVPGDRVALFTGNDPAFLFVALAVARTGAVLVPIGAREQQAGVSHMVRDSGASLLFYQEALENAIPAPAPDRGLKEAIAIGSERFDAMLSSDPLLPEPDDEEALAAILYTSGTTGAAKGVPLSHGAIVHSAMSYGLTMGLGPDDRSIAAVPLSHVTGLVALFAAMLRAQGTLVLMRHFSASLFLDLAEREGMTHTVMVPAMYNLCLLDGSFAARDLSSWRVAGFGGAPMPVPTMEQLVKVAPGLKLMNLYGATETTSPAVIMPPEHALDRPESVGQAAPGCEILIVDEDGREVDAGGIGEIWIRGAMVTAGYWRSKTSAADFPDGFWRSGDLGSIDDAGFVTLHGRKKDVINRGGYKIFPAEVEGALAGLSGVIEAAVVARPCAVLGERVHAVVVVDEATELDCAATLRAAIALRFADYKIPESWDIRREALPRNANGKVVKRLIEAALSPYEHGPGSEGR